MDKPSMEGTDPLNKTDDGQSDVPDAPPATSFRNTRWRWLFLVFGCFFLLGR